MAARVKPCVVTEVGKGVGKSAHALARTPVDLAVAVAQGFHNAPRLYGDDTVRRPPRVTGIQSGLKAARYEFVYGVYDDAATSPSLEQQNDLAGTDIVPVAKTLIVDLNSVTPMPAKIEGLAILDDTTIAVANDNDFDINEFDADGKTIPTGRASQVFVIGLPAPLGIAE